MNDRDFAQALHDFLKRTDPAGVSDEDMRMQTNLALLVIWNRASTHLAGGYSLLEPACQGPVIGGGGPHKRLEQLLRDFGIQPPLSIPS
jgi:hypothetical protein